MESSKDEARKKRDSEVYKDETTLPLKKLRSFGARLAAEEDEKPAADTNSLLHEKVRKNHIVEFNSARSKGHDRPRSWDLESALHRLILVGTRTTRTDTDEAKNSENDIIERLSPTTTLHFRLGHGGDASVIAELYRSSQGESCRIGRLRDDNTNTASSTAALAAATGDGATTDAVTSLTVTDELEVWLADAMGNEDVPPSAFVLIAELHEHADDEKEAPDTNGHQELESITAEYQPPEHALIGALAILTRVWESGSRMLRVEWLYVRRDHSQADLIERRMYLRLSTLALMTQSDGIIIKESVKSAPKKGDAEVNGGEQLDSL